MQIWICTDDDAVILGVQLFITITLSGMMMKVNVGALAFFLNLIGGARKRWRC